MNRTTGKSSEVDIWSILAVKKGPLSVKYNNVMNKLPVDPIIVLLADDHVIVRAGIRQFLEQNSGIKVIAEASNGKEACDLIQKVQPDVIVLDIQMPEMSGIEVVRWIRANHLPVGILILSAFDDSPYIQAVLQAGANGYVLKTAEPPEIVAAVIDVFNGKSVLDSSLAIKVFNTISEPIQSPLNEPLTERELKVLTLVAQGFTNKAVAVQLSISDRTVQNHLAKVFQKLNAESRTEAVMRAVAAGLISANVAEETLHF
jgi:DNA-binding NarL/FixJ family response regulator